MINEKHTTQTKHIMHIEVGMLILHCLGFIMCHMLIAECMCHRYTPAEETMHLVSTAACCGAAICISLVTSEIRSGITCDATKCILPKACTCAYLTLI